MTIGILLVHLSPNDLAPETYDFVDHLNRQTDAYFIARHGWILAFGNIRRLLRSSTALAGWTARRAVKSFPVWYLDDGPLLQQLNRYLKSQVRRRQKNRPALWDRTEIRFREYIEASRQPIYRTPYRPSFWNLRDYRAKTRLKFKSGHLIWADRQHGGPIRNIPFTAELAAIYLLWLKPPKKQRLLERIGRLYKEDCWSPLILGVPFDQSPSAYLYPEHAPERPPIVGRVEEPKWDYQKLLADQPAHNARLGSYWSLGVGSDGTVGLSKIIRSIGSLNIKTIELRDNMIGNLENDFARDEAKVA